MTPCNGPIKTWGDVAAVLHLSRDTLERHRRRFGRAGDRTRPWFENPAAVVAWYTALRATHGTEAPAVVPSGRRVARSAAVFDPVAIRRDLGGDR